MKKMVVNRGSSQGNLVDMTPENIAQSAIDEAAHEDKIAAAEAALNAPYKPSDLEILLDALEKKSGITQDDKDASRQALIDAKA